MGSWMAERVTQTDSIPSEVNASLLNKKQYQYAKAFGCGSSLWSQSAVGEGLSSPLRS